MKARIGPDSAEAGLPRFLSLNAYEGRQTGGKFQANYKSFNNFSISFSQLYLSLSPVKDYSTINEQSRALIFQAIENSSSFPCPFVSLHQP